MRFIYKVENIKNKKVYIGQTKNISTRKSQHKYLLKRGIHKNSILQEDWNIYGEESFVWSYIEECENADEREQYWINFYKEKTNGNVYNIMHSKLYKSKIKGRTSPMKGLEHSELTKERMSISQKNRVRDAGIGDKISKTKLKMTQEEEELIIKLRKEGMSYFNIGKHVRFNWKTVRTFIIKNYPELRVVKIP